MRERAAVMIRPYTDQLRSAADALTGWASTADHLPHRCSRMRVAPPQNVWLQYRHLLDARRSVVLDQDLDRLPDVAAALRRALSRGTLAQRAVLLLRGRRLVHAEVGLHCLFVVSCV